MRDWQQWFPVSLPYGLKEQHAWWFMVRHSLAVVPESDISGHHNSVDLQGRLVTPGLIDCHTHLVFGGDRAAEWEQRLNGISYQTISAQGGGINATVTATRNSTPETLLRSAQQRLQRLMDEGVTTLEIKSIRAERRSRREDAAGGESACAG